MQKVFVNIKEHQEKELTAKQQGITRPKIFCMVYTYEARHDQIRAIRQSWANKCDGFSTYSYCCRLSF